MLEKLRTQRILGAIGIVAVLLGIILPYYDVTILGYSYKISLWNYWEGKIILALTVANLLFIFKDLVEKYVPQMFNSAIGQKIKNANDKFAIVPIILIVAFVVILFLRVDTDSSLDHGLGFYSLWLGIISLVAHTFLYKKKVETSPTQSNVTIIDSPIINNVNAVPNNQATLNNQQAMPNLTPQTPTVDVTNVGQVNTEPILNNTQNDQQTIQNNTNTNIKYCPQCGNKCDVSVNHCPMCGKAF